MNESTMSPLNSRRHMLQSASCGFGYLALSALCGSGARSARAADLLPKVPVHTPRAKRVIFLCMSGGPAHLDTFDYKPQTGKKPHPGSAFKFAQHGQSGQWVSELMPHIAQHVDKLCVLNGMYCDTGNHAQSFLQLHTGERLRPRPSMGAWINYGLGTPNHNLPGFISLNTSKPSVYSSGFLPPVYEGTPIGINGEDMNKASIANIAGTHVSPAIKRQQLDFVQAMNHRHAAARARPDDLEAVIQSMELGYRMQSAAPPLLDTSRESEQMLERYRVGKQKAGKTCKQTDFGRQCLLALRFAEAGVRFIEVNHGSWDQHKYHRAETQANCEAVDAPIAALLEDLERRGMLDDTLVVWGGEFGRPGLTPGAKKDETGHNPRGFTFWLAGGGVKRGYTHGKTDGTGANAVEGRMHFRDLHATILHLVGLDHSNLTYRHEGREHRLTGPTGGKVVDAILA